MKTIRMVPRVLGVVAALAGAGCGSTSKGGSGDMTDLDASAVSMFAGTFNGTYSGTYVITTPAGQPGGSNTESATVTTTVLANGELQMTWQLANEPPSGVIDFVLQGDVGMAVGAQTGGMCFMGTLSNGNTQTNCCTTCSLTFSGNDSFTQPNMGTFTGTTAQGDPYSGTYTGAWTGTRQ
jgi:hypothetical protein